MSTSAIFSTAPSTLDAGTTSAIFVAGVTALVERSTSAIFVTQEEGVSVYTTFGSVSSAPFLGFEQTSFFGPTSKDIFISPSQASVFGATSSDQYQTVADRGIGFRGEQFRFNTIGLDRFSAPLGAVLNIYTDLDLTTTATTPIYTVPTNNSAIIMGCLIRIKSADTVSTDAEISVGIDPSNSDLFDVETLVNVRSVHDFWSFWKSSATGSLATTGDVLNLEVVTAATATTLTADVYIIGLLLS